jgi:hypothetical protein
MSWTARSTGAVASITRRPRRGSSSLPRPDGSHSVRPSAGRATREGVEIAYGVAEVLPLLLQDHVQAGQGGFRMLRSPGVRPWHGQLLGTDGGQEVAYGRLVLGAHLEHLGVGRRLGGEDGQVETILGRFRSGQADGVKGLILPRTAFRSQMSVARIRWRSVWAKDHSPATEMSTVPGGMPTARSSRAAQERSSVAQAVRRPSGSPARRSARRESDGRARRRRRG